MFGKGNKSDKWLNQIGTKEGTIYGDESEKCMSRKRKKKNWREIEAKKRRIEVQVVLEEWQESERKERKGKERKEERKKERRRSIGKIR